MKEQMKKIALLSLSLILTSAYSVSIVLPSLLQHFSEYTTAQVEILISAPSFAITVMIVLNAWLSRYMKDRPMIVGGLLLLSVSGMVPMYTILIFLHPPPGWFPDILLTAHIDPDSL